MARTRAVKGRTESAEFVPRSLRLHLSSSKRCFTGLRVQPAHHSSGALAGEIDSRDQGVGEENQDSIFESFDGDVFSREGAADVPLLVVHIDVS